MQPLPANLIGLSNAGRNERPQCSPGTGQRNPLHDYVLFSANTGLRPDEARRLQFRDVTIVEDEASGQTILEIEVRGKRGVGYCKSMSGARFEFRSDGLCSYFRTEDLFCLTSLQIGPESSCVGAWSAKRWDSRNHDVLQNGPVLRGMQSLVLKQFRSSIWVLPGPLLCVRSRDKIF